MKNISRTNAGLAGYAPRSGRLTRVLQLELRSVTVRRKGATTTQPASYPSTSVVHPVSPMPAVYGLGILIPSVGLAIQGQNEKNQHRKYYGHNNKLY
jgi:hypothetical protein